MRAPDFPAFRGHHMRLSRAIYSISTTRPSSRLGQRSHKMFVSASGLTLGLFHGTSYAARAGWEGSGLDFVCGLFGNRDPTGALVLPEVFVGIIDASITRKPAGPCTRNSSF